LMIEQWELNKLERQARTQPTQRKHEKYVKPLKWNKNLDSWPLHKSSI
jgi:hypothetical protein